VKAVWRRVGILVGGTSALWAVIVYPASLWEGESAWLLSAVAMVLCLAPAAASMVWISATADPTQQIYAWLGGSGVRLFLVLSVALVLIQSMPETFDTAFIVWLLVFYLFTLALEVGLIIPRQEQGKPDG
jgi:hypothetical protein